MATPTTTIKVPVVLRDRLAARVRKDSVPLSVVIDEALSSIEEQEFWAAVRTDNRRMSNSERERYNVEDTSLDDPQDDADDAISAAGGW